MTYTYEYAYLVVASFFLGVYVVAHFLLLGRQGKRRSKVAMTLWLLLVAALGGSFLYALVDFSQAFLGQVDHDVLGTLIIMAILLATCVGAWREVESLLHVRPEHPNAAHQTEISEGHTEMQE